MEGENKYIIGILFGATISIIALFILGQEILSESFLYASVCTSSPDVTQPAECGYYDSIIEVMSISILIIGVLTVRFCYSHI